MNVANSISICVSKIVKNHRFVKDILNSIISLNGKVLLVGGAVRDIFLDLPMKDLDFEVYGLTMNELQQVLEQHGHVSLIGKSFGVLRLHGLNVDWSLPRKDSSGRHPIVVYDQFMSYEQAFIRRDLTINAMGVDMQSFVLIDPYGGMNDLQNKILRSPDLDFFAQDPLRVLRVMQFVGRLEMQVDEKLSDLCRNIDISTVSSERIEQEFLKLFLQSQRPSTGLKWLISINKFCELLPNIKTDDLLWLKLDNAAQQNYTTEQEKIVIMWAIIISFLDVPEQNYNFERLNYKKKQVYLSYIKRITRQKQMSDQIANIVLYAQMMTVNITDIQMKWLAVWLAPEVSIRLLSKFMKIMKSQQVSENILEQAEKLRVSDHSEDPVLTGKDFLDVADGPQVGLLVKKSYELQINQGLTDKSELKKIVISLI